MAAEIIDGRAIAAAIRGEVKTRVEDLVRDHAVRPGLGVVLVGDNPASRSYVTMKEKACAEAGIHSEEAHLPVEASQDAVIGAIGAYATNPSIHAILVQLPLPDHIDEHAVLLSVPPSKDADGFHPFPVGELWSQGTADSSRARPMACWFLKRSDVPLIAPGRVIGRSNIVGKPVASLLLREHCTVTMCHSRTRDLPGVAREADILVVAIGRPRMVDASYIKPGATVIDVGISRAEDGSLVGDVDFESASQVAGKITPVPKGVGPMTIAMLLQSTVNAAARAVS